MLGYKHLFRHAINALAFAGDASVVEKLGMPVDVVTG
jgi:hypothetical protein